MLKVVNATKDSEQLSIIGAVTILAVRKFLGEETMRGGADGVFRSTVFRDRVEFDDKNELWLRRRLVPNAASILDVPTRRDFVSLARSPLRSFTNGANMPVALSGGKLSSFFRPDTI